MGIRPKLVRKREPLPFSITPNGALKSKSGWLVHYYVARKYPEIELRLHGHSTMPFRDWFAQWIVHMGGPNGRHEDFPNPHDALARLLDYRAKRPRLIRKRR